MEKNFFLSMTLVFIKLLNQSNVLLAAEHSDNLVQETKQDKNSTQKAQNKENVVQPAICDGVTERILLIFSLLSYYNPVKILNNEQHNRQHIDAYDFLKKLKEDPKFESSMGRCINTDEIQGWELVGNCEFSDFYAQFWGKGECLIVAFRGTLMNSYKTWQENIKYILFSPVVPHEQIKFAKGCSRAIFDQPQINKKYNTILFTGHSLGGLLATYASVNFSGLTQEFVDKLSSLDKKMADSFRKKIGLFTFNGLGCSRNLRKKVEKRFTGIRALNFRTEDDKVSKIGYHLGRIRSFFCEHDASNGRFYHFMMGSHSIYHFFSIKRFMLSEPKTEDLDKISDSQVSDDKNQNV